MVISLQKDIDDIQSIPIVPTMLDFICQTTGMGFAAIARVTADRWLTCGVLDQINFGLKPGDELEVESTICHEVRQAKELVVIDHVKEDAFYCSHHTPLQYGFQSYISVPIIRKNGEFFGTLCAIDPKPNKLNNKKIIGMFAMFADLLAFHLNAIDLIESKDAELKTKAVELQSYEFVSSHDLQEPLRKIQMFSSRLEDDSEILSEGGRKYVKKIKSTAKGMRRLLNDLLAHAEAENVRRELESTDLADVVKKVESRLTELLVLCNGKIVTHNLGSLTAVPLQIEQLLYNIIHNSIMYRSPERDLVVTVTMNVHKGAHFRIPRLTGNKDYCELTIADNGIGFAKKHNKEIFKIFERLSSGKTNTSSGIGLAIAKKIVANHNGAILAEGKVGLGATFKIYLPIQA